MTESDIEFRVGKNRLKKLKELGFLKEENGYLHISFLDQQLQECDQTREKKKLAGSIGGQASAKQRQARAKQVLKSAKATVKQDEADLKQNEADKIRKDKNKIIVETIISYLNGKTGRRYTVTNNYSSLILKIISSGFTEDQIKKVIDHKTLQWSVDPKMKPYLRPETIFGEKFQSYLNETIEIKKQAVNGHLNGYKTWTQEEVYDEFGER